MYRKKQSRKTQLRIFYLCQAIQIVIGALILCLSASVLQIHEVHFTGDVALFLIVVIQVSLIKKQILHV